MDLSLNPVRQKRIGEGMKFLRYASSCLALFAFIFLYESLIHNYVLMSMYQATSEVWRDFAKMETMMPLALSYQLALSAWSAFIFSKIYPEGGIQKGLMFGLFFGVFAGILTSSWYLWLNVPAGLGLSWFFCGIGEGIGGGLVLGMIYRNRRARQLS